MSTVLKFIFKNVILKLEIKKQVESKPSEGNLCNLYLIYILILQCPNNSLIPVSRNLVKEMTNIIETSFEHAFFFIFCLFKEKQFIYLCDFTNQGVLHLCKSLKIIFFFVNLKVKPLLFNSLLGSYFRLTSSRISWF